MAVFAAIALLTTQWLCAQTEAASTPTSDSSQTESRYNEIDERSIPIILTDDASSNAGIPSRRGGIGVYVRMVLALLFIVALIYIVFRFLKSGSLPSNERDQFLRRVSSLSVGVNKSVQVITLVDKAYLIGVSDSSVQLLANIEDKELIQAMNLYADKHDGGSRPKSFSDVLDLFMPRSSSEHTVFEDETSTRILKSLNEQGRRLHDKEEI